MKWQVIKTYESEDGGKRVFTAIYERSIDARKDFDNTERLLECLCGTPEIKFYKTGNTAEREMSVRFYMASYITLEIKVAKED